MKIILLVLTGALLFWLGQASTGDIHLPFFRGDNGQTVADGNTQQQPVAPPPAAAAATPAPAAAMPTVTQIAEAVSNELDPRLAAIEGSLTTNTGDIDALEASDTRHDADISGLRGQVDELGGRMTGIGDRLGSIEHAVEQVSDRLNSIVDSIAENATAQAAALEAARQELTGQINEQFAVINGRLDVLEAAQRVDIGPPGDIDLPLLPITPFSQDFSPPPVVEEPEEEAVASAPVPILPPSGTPATSVANVPLPPVALGPVCQAPALPALAPECPTPALLPVPAPEPAPVEEQEADCDCEPAVVVVVAEVLPPLPRPRPHHVYTPPAPPARVIMVADVQPAPRPAPPPAPPVVEMVCYLRVATWADVHHVRPYQGNMMVYVAVDGGSRLPDDAPDRVRGNMQIEVPCSMVYSRVNLEVCFGGPESELLDTGLLAQYRAQYESARAAGMSRIVLNPTGDPIWWDPS